MLPLGLMVIYIVLYDLCSFLPVYYPEIIGFLNVLIILGTDRVNNCLALGRKFL